jgi:hypothetical protein
MSEHEEKKVSLDDLPDEEAPAARSRAKASLKAPLSEPRIEQLKNADDRTKIQVLEKSWTFDQHVSNFGWLVYAGVMLTLEFLPAYQMYLDEIELMNAALFDIGGDLIRDYTKFFETIIRHPGVFILLTPLIFSLTSSSPSKFEISFDGIQTVKNFEGRSPHKEMTSLLIKWNDITRVEKTFRSGDEVLRLYSGQYHLGDIIWYISNEKKLAIKLLLQTLVNANHPLLVFLQSEKDLE